MATVTKRRGRYVLDFYDHQGKRQRRALKPGTTMKQARKALHRIEEQVSRGIYIEESRIPTFKQVADSWLEHKKASLRASTWSVYEGHTKNHFNEFLDLKVNRITPALIERFISSRQAEGKPINTVRKVLVTLSQILKYAARHGYLTYNPLSVAERPRPPQETEPAAVPAIRVLSPSQISAFLAAVKDPKYRTLFMLAIMSGARQGELLGLKWPDVDWNNNQLRIERTFNNEAWYQPKTKGSRRRIDLGPSMMRELKLWRLACLPNELDLIFPSGSGKPIDHHNLVKRHFLPALTKAGIGKVRFHDLRHTFASLLIEQGENIKYIQTQLGHSTPTVTLNVYAHLMKSANQEAACRLEDKIFGTGHNLVTINEKGAAATSATP